MDLYQNRQIYPYFFLLGNCLIWYGTSDIFKEIYLVLFVIPFLILYRSTYVLIALICGLCFAEYTAVEQQRWKFPEQQVNNNHLLTGVIIDLPESSGDIVRFGFKVSNMNNLRLSVKTPVYFRLSCYRNCPEFKVEQKWQLLVRLKPANGYINAEGFDYEKWLYLKQYKATGYIIPSFQNNLLSTKTGIHSLRQEIQQIFLKKIDDEAVAGTVIALTLGDKSHLQSREKELLAKNGISHLFAISGLHVGLSAVPGFLFAGFLWRRMRIFQKFCCHQFQWFACLFPAIFYTALSGFGLPANRALIMLLVFVFAQLLRISSSTHCRFSLTLWIIMISQPLASLDISFWLSFCVTAFLILLGKLSQTDHSLLHLTRLQTQLFVLLLPIQLYIFGGVSLISPVMNSLAIPFVSVCLLPLLLINMMLILFSIPGAEQLLWFIEQLLRLFWLMVYSTESCSDAFFVTQSPYSNAELLLLPFFVMLLLTFDISVKAVILIFLVLFQTPRRSDVEFRLLVLDVGQGLAISVDYQDKLMLYDTAYGSADFSTAQITLMPWLKSLSASNIDLLVVGHNDADHAGGIAAVLQEWPVNNLIIGPDVVIPENTPVPPLLTSNCSRGQKWQWQQLSINILSPGQDNKLSAGNDSSCVVLLEFMDKKLLLTGDIESAAEKQLLRNYPELSIDVLLVPHHGSKTSSGIPFIKQLKPEYAIVSSGYLNRFNHPAEVVIKRYEKNAVKVLNTAYSGAIEVTINNQGLLAIKQWRKEKTALWRRQ